MKENVLSVDRMIISPGRELTRVHQFQHRGPTTQHVRYHRDVTGQIGENDDMYDRLVEHGELEGDTENNFVTVSDDNTIDISHVYLTTSCLHTQRQVI